MSITSTNSLVLSNTDTDILLSLLEWRYAVTPTGELAPQPAMMGNRRPVCHLVKREDRFVTEITTQSNWTRNLVQNDVLWGNVNTDFDALQILAQCKMLFPHMMNELPLASPCSSVRKILHLVQCETKAHFSLVNMMRLVKSFEQKLRTAVASWPENKQSCYEALDKIFCLYGFLVPTKITLGKKKIVRQEYVEDASRSKSASMLAKAQANKSLARMNSMDDDLKGIHAPTPKDEIIKQRYELLLYNQHDGSGTQFEFWEIIKRTDLQPIYELLPNDLGRKVKFILYERSNPIQIGDIIRLQSLATSSYLAWRLDDQLIEPGLCRPAADSSIHSLAQWRLRRTDYVHTLNTQAKYGHRIFIEAVLGPVDNDLCVLLSPKLPEDERQDLTLTQNKDWNDESSWWIEYAMPSTEPESVDMSISKIKPLIHGDIISLSQNRLARYLSSRKILETTTDLPPIIRRRTSSFGSAGSVISRIRRMSLTRSTIAMAVNHTAMDWDKLQLIECGSTDTTEDEKWVILSDKVNHFAARAATDLTSDIKDSNPPPQPTAQPTRHSATPRFLPAIAGAIPIYRNSTGTDYSLLDPNEVLLDASDQFTTTTDASSFSMSGITTVSLKSFRSVSLASPSVSAFSWDAQNNYDAPIFELLKKKKPFAHRAKELIVKASLISLREIGRKFK